MSSRQLLHLPFRHKEAAANDHEVQHEGDEEVSRLNLTTRANKQGEPLLKAPYGVVFFSSFFMSYQGICIYGYNGPVASRMQKSKPGPSLPRTHLMDPEKYLT